VGHATSDGRETGQQQNRPVIGGAERKGRLEQSRARQAGDVADATRRGFRIDRSASWHAGHADQREPAGSVEHASGEQVWIPRRARQPRSTSALAHAGGEGLPEQRRRRDESEGLAAASFWSDCDWLACVDGKVRPVEPGTFPLAHGLPARVGRLRGYGNAIVPQVAAEVIAAYMEICE